MNRIKYTLLLALALVLFGTGCASKSSTENKTADSGQTTEDENRGDAPEGMPPPPGGDGEMAFGGSQDGRPGPPPGGFGGTPPEGSPGGQPPEGMPPGAPPGGGSMEVDHGSYAYLISEDLSGGSYESTGDMENVLRIEGEEVLLEDLVITKSGGQAGAGESSNFYGSNAAVLALNGADVIINDSRIITSVRGGNGIFSYGEGTEVEVNRAYIRTTGNSSGGVMVTGGGTMTVNDSDIETRGGSSAALRTDRGGGTLIVDGGTYTANGNGSPAVYSTADITVKNAVLKAGGSEAVVVEGKNSVSLYDCTVSGNMIKDNVENLQNVMIYQSMSGDAETGQSHFTMEGGSLSSGVGDMFYVTNTDCTITLKSVDLELSNSVVLKVSGNDARNGWGQVGANGGNCDMLTKDQVLKGDIIVDEISSLELSLTEGSVFTGTINSGDQGGTVDLAMDAGSRWVLTGDSYIDSLRGQAGSIETGAYTLYVNGTRFE